MKIVQNTVLTVAAGLLFSCEKPVPDEPQVDAPVLVSSIPANGDSNIKDDSLTITLTFDKNVFSPITGRSLVTLIGSNSDTVGIKSVAASRTNVTIKTEKLRKSTTYTLTVPDGVITGPAKVPAPQVTITFSTVDTQNVQTSELVTQNPSPEAINLYNFLKENYGHKIISGTVAKVAWNTDEAEMVFAATGKYPAMNTFDYIHLWASPANWIDYTQTQIVEEWWNSGGIVSACWHWNVPVSQNATQGQVTFRPEETTFRPANALIAGTWENTVMKADLQKMAEYLKLLQQKNIPVIWRPLHEGAGNIYAFQGGTAWFWWGRDGANAYVALWRYMFNYFQQQGLNNLIWVWTTQVNDGPFYPGDDYVDIVGRDLYNESSAAAAAAEFSAIAEKYTDKLVTLSECGNVATISGQWAAGAKWSFFMPWYDYDNTNLNGHEHADLQWWQNAANNPLVIMRSGVPDLK
ncbi:MAG: Ig-like domain-containing protein [Bacteroidales bacterium]|nr:Ig-like domain-containing protein [Bacteroidales bacterium]